MGGSRTEERWKAMKTNLLISGFAILAILVMGCAPAYAPTPAPPATPTAPAAPTPTPAPPPTPYPAPKPPPTSTPTPEAAAIEITVTAKFATFEPSTITVAEGQTVKLTLTSKDAPHTFTIDELGINIAVGSGQTATEEFTVEKAGTFSFYCAVPGHRDAGMEGTLEATE